MPKLSLTLHRPLISKADGSVLGEVRDVYFDENCRNIAYFIVLCNERECLLPFSAVAAFGDAVMTDDGLALLSPYDADRSALVRSLLGKPVFTGAGNLKGALDDVVFTLKGKVTALQAGDSSYSPSSFRSLGDVLLLKSNARRKTPQVPFPVAETDAPVSVLSDGEGKPVAPSPESRDGAESLSDSALCDGGNKRRSAALAAVDGKSAYATAPEANAVRTPAEGVSFTPPVIRAGDAPPPAVYPRDSLAAPLLVAAAQEDFTPRRIIADYNFLLGRVLEKDVLSYRGERLASLGERVTVETVEKARRHGKLIDLTLSSR